jgi:hypothetical protein
MRSATLELEGVKVTLAVWPEKTVQPGGERSRCVVLTVSSYDERSKEWSEGFDVRASTPCSFKKVGPGDVGPVN